MKIVLSWSGGKDSSLALLFLSEEGRRPQLLLTTLSASTGRVTMHGVGRELIRQQFLASGIEGDFLTLNGNDHAQYEKDFRAKAIKLAGEGYTHMAFGDIFLEDLREYRNGLLEGTGLKPLYPLWGMNTQQLARQFYYKGFKAVACCVSEKLLGKDWCGRMLDKSFFENLPDGVDPCGENGEFHSFCFAGPVFEKEIQFEQGEKIVNDYGEDFGRFWFCSLEK